MVTQRGHSDHAAHRGRRAERQGRVLSTAAPRIAITTDWLTSFGGAERVLHHLHSLYPAAPIYTSVFDPVGLPDEVRTWDVRPTFLQKLPLVRRYSRVLLPLMPAAFDRLDLSEYDVVITASSAFSKNVRLEHDAKNVCYCHTPPRYLWDLTDQYLGGVARMVAAPTLHWLREADRKASQRVDVFVANSNTVADRIRRAYNRDAQVIYPPVDTDRIRPNGLPPEDFYLVVARFVGYKRVDLAIAACNRLKRKLVVVGSGPEASRLRADAGPTVSFTGSLDDTAVTDLYARCRAFLFPGLEDFGIAAVEAQAAGRPVIAYGVGGGTETVIDGRTGVFFSEQTADALADAIERFERMSLGPAVCRENAERFDARVFKDHIADVVSAAAAS